MAPLILNKNGTPSLPCVQKHRTSRLLVHIRMENAMALHSQNFATDFKSHKMSEPLSFILTKACVLTHTQLIEEWTTWSVVWDGIQLSFRNLTQRIVSPKAHFLLKSQARHFSSITIEFVDFF